MVIRPSFLVRGGSFYFEALESGGRPLKRFGLRGAIMVRLIKVKGAGKRNWANEVPA